MQGSYDFKYIRDGEVIAHSSSPNPIEGFKDLMDKVPPRETVQEPTSSLLEKSGMFMLMLLAVTCFILEIIGLGYLAYKFLW